ncbi:MAG: T9SS type A sorting domain-containing protein [Candidatus Kapabacteria bacterium]|nr:T9SS type A sorting domain-containing protein [Candidatus Kapabacteria bacterium]
MVKLLTTAVAGAALTLALAMPVHAQRIMGIKSSYDEACKLMELNPSTAALTHTGYVHDYSIGYIQYGSSTIDPVSGRYYILTEIKNPKPNDPNDFDVKSIIRSVNTNNGSFVQYEGFESYNGPFQLEFNMRNGKLYGVDRGYHTGVRLLHFNPATGTSSVVGTYNQIQPRHTGDKHSAFDSDNERYVYMVSRLRPTYSVALPAVAYINVNTGGMELKDVNIVSDNEYLNNVFNTSISHLSEIQYDDVTDAVLAVWGVNDDRTRVVKINSNGDMTVLADYPAPSAGVQMVFDQATGRIVLQLMNGSDISNSTGMIYVINARTGEQISQVETTEVIGNWECDNSQFAALRFRSSTTSVENDPATNGGLTLAPNPTADGMVRISATKPVESLTVSSMLGEVVITRSGTETLTMPELASGTYMVEARFADGTRSVRQLNVLR